jgi:hypothetical protein
MSAIASKVITVARTLGPYLMIELLLPGGSLVALLLCLYRSSRRASGEAGPAEA